MTPARPHRPGLEPGALDPESSALTIRPPRLSQTINKKPLLTQPPPASQEAQFELLPHLQIGVQHQTQTRSCYCIHRHLNRPK